MKYPKLAAALDDFLATQVNEWGDMAVAMFIKSMTEPVVEKKVAIPVTKELVLSHQEEVRDGD